MNSRLSVIEKRLIVECFAVYKSFPPEYYWRGYKGIVDLEYAFGVSGRWIKKLDGDYISNGFDVPKKVRSDKGTTIFNSDKRRNATINSKCLFLDKLEEKY